jgi:hypothetical protein
VPPDADAGEAYRRLVPAAVASLLATLDGMAAGTVKWREQRGAASYAAKIGPDDRLIDWIRPSSLIAAQVRALSPHIGAVTELLGRRTVVWRAHAGEGALPQSEATGSCCPPARSWLEVLELQQEGRRRMTAAGSCRERALAEERPGAASILARPRAPSRRARQAGRLSAALRLDGLDSAIEGSRRLCRVGEAAPGHRRRARGGRLDHRRGFSRCTGAPPRATALPRPRAGTPPVDDNRPGGLAWAPDAQVRERRADRRPRRA